MDLAILHDKLESIQELEEFLDFVENLSVYLQGEPRSWQNRTVPMYLEAIVRWTDIHNMSAREENKPVIEQASWKQFAEMLLVATLYE